MVDLPPTDELANVPPELLGIMRDMRQAIEQRFDVNARDASFARLGALAALGATPGGFQGHLRHLLAEGVTAAEVWAVMYSIIGHIGMPRFVSILPALEAELGGGIQALAAAQPSAG
jgi:alkylhydroperoxidase/carboxymuconolactone decarboxylase family protein YurZ